MDKYRIYIDESGHANMNSAEIPNERFLSLTGVIIKIDYVNNFLHNDMENLKKRYFSYNNRNPVIFHRKEIVNQKGSFKILKDKKIRAKFYKDLLDRLENWDYIVITALIDKKEHKDKYKVWTYDPYHYCLSIILERYLFILEKKAIGDVMVEGRNTNDDMRLKKAFENIYEKGTDKVDAKRFQNFLTSKKLKVKKKKNNVSGLQIADLIAQPSRNDLLMRLGLKCNNKYLGREIIKILTKNKYHREKDSGEILGYGLKKLP